MTPERQDIERRRAARRLRAIRYAMLIGEKRDTIATIAAREGLVHQAIRHILHNACPAFIVPPPSPPEFKPPPPPPERPDWSRPGPALRQIARETRAEIEKVWR
jgi:hypothetical protein